MERTIIKKGDQLKCVALCQGLRMGHVYTAQDNAINNRVKVVGTNNQSFAFRTNYFEVVRPIVISSQSTTSPLEQETTLIEETGMKAGTKVVCIAGPYQDITRNTVYTLIEPQQNHTIVIVNDMGNKALYRVTSFKPDSEMIREGDWLECIANRTSLKAGNLYQALTNEADGKVVVKNDRGHEQNYYIRLFRKHTGEVKQKVAVEGGFKRNDVLLCVKKNHKRNLKVGLKYVAVEDQDGDTITIKHSFGTLPYPASCFKLYEGEDNKTILGMMERQSLEDDREQANSPEEVHQEPFSSNLAEKTVDVEGHVSTPAFTSIDQLDWPGTKEEEPKTLFAPTTRHITPEDDSNAHLEPHVGPLPIPAGYEPFDYEEAKKRPEDVITRSGLKTWIGGYNATALEFNRLIGWADGVGHSWSVEGRYHEDGKDTHLDLFIRSLTRTFYRNEYPFERKEDIYELCDSLEEAEAHCESGHIAVTKIVYEGKKLKSISIVKHY